MNLDSVSGYKPIRVWDLPTRAFHWLLVVLVVFSVITAYIGGNAMVWHMRSGFAILTLLAFRLVWGFVGGHWSRFRAFVYAPSTSLRYLRGQSMPHEHHNVGHNPLGAGSVFALLAILALQVATGLVADDEIATTGPLNKFVSSATSALATTWHKTYGKWIIFTLVALHIGAIAFYWFRRRQNLIGPMLHGDKLLTADVPHAVDNGRTRTVALAVVLVCALAVTAVVRLGG